MNVFIIGAGLTKAIFPDAPLNSDLLETLTGFSPDSVIPTLCERYKTKDIEIALTRLDADIALSRYESMHTADELSTLRRGIEDELARYFGSFRVSDNLMNQPQWLSYLLNDAFTVGDVAVSLNYDCVFEAALDCCGKWSPNGGYGHLDNPLASSERPKSPITVLKIHGSANFVIAPYVDKPIADAVSFEFDECFFPCSAKNAHLWYGAGTGRSYLIAPSYVKIPTVEITYLMLEALEASTQAKNLVVIGSALRPEDGFLTVLVTNFLRHKTDWRSRKIIVVDPAAQTICDRLKKYWGVDVSNQILPIADRVEVSVARLLETMRA